MTKANPLCPCESGLPLVACCAPLHAGAAARSAEALMRSRYSAYVLQLAPHVLATWHASTRPAQLQLDASTRWLGLSVKRHEAAGEGRAIVEFVARYRDGGSPAVRLHEVSRFVFEQERWWYVDGEQRASK